MARNLKPLLRSVYIDRTQLQIGVRSSGAIHLPQLEATKYAVNLITLGELRQAKFMTHDEPSLDDFWQNGCQLIFCDWDLLRLGRQGESGARMPT